MREIEMKRSHGSVRALALFAYISVLIVSLSGCKDDKDGSSAHMGKVSLNLRADTTSLKKGIHSSVTKAVSDEFADFLTVDDYRILIVAGTDTAKQYDRFDKMPAEFDLPEGSYSLIASKGNNLPAEYENPYFEGSTDFTVKEGMSSPLDVTCSLGNTRIMAEYTDDFKEAYSEYTVLLSSANTTADFEIAKGETRPAYMQVAKDGTDVAIGIRLKKVNAEEEKTYYVPNAIKMERRQNVRLIFKTDGEALEGIGLDVMLDDSLATQSFTTKIPDFMWQQFEKPTLSAVDFKGDGTDEIFKTSAGSFNQDLQVGVVMKGGIGSLKISYWKDGETEEDAISYDLATDDGVAAAKAKYFTWTFGDKATDINLLKKKTAQLYLKGGINSLESLEDASCIYNFKISGYDATGKQNVSNDLQFKVEVLPAEAPIVTSKPTDKSFEITEGDELAADWELDFAASGLIDKDETKVIVDDGSGKQEYHFMKDDDTSLNSAFDAKVEIENNAHAVISFPKEFAASLSAPEEGSKNYTFTFYLKDEIGKVDKLTKTITVNAPVFTLESTNNDAFARRIVLRVNTSGKEDKKHLSFEYRAEDGSNWLSVKSSGLKQENDNTRMDQIQYVDTLKGLLPNTEYSVRAVYNKNTPYVRYSKEQSLLTEAEQGFRNGKLVDPLDDWSIEADANGSTKPGYNKAISGGSPFTYLEDPWRCWEVWLPYTSDHLSDWNTLNKKTTSNGGCRTKAVVATTNNAWTRYVANSGTIKAEGVSKSAALIRTVGWGEGNTAGGIGSIIKHSTPGELYLGKYDGKAIYGIEFTSRPSGFYFNYKYEKPMKGNDVFTAEIVVLDDNGATVSKQFNSSVVTSGWNEAYVKLNYMPNVTKAKSMYIKFISGKAGSYGYSDFPVQADFANLSNGEYTGSHLYIDNVELIYE